ncbi:ankyrin repeat%2C SAM and basic leucine zipper domain-containing protein 1 [Xyrichtys novacula]|uniref:Ankyrin repeat, SAM and basic leucine zipper domain-containing protein 1 n=1 Tax=Xyrichtys novacula TaxID=13765 RepID=A0AAV1F546_XYRNO|nr:ankyrin repeat%2C SAM and basic leucine zipper domain-containing protein 1 [Xyrichtys novacula]
MGSYLENAFPAGDESDASDYEWDIGSFTDKKPSSKKILDAVVPQAEDNVSVLKRAISAGDIDTVEQLLDNGMDVETRLGFEWTPLMCAVNVANYDLAKLLLDRGASANFSKDNLTVLMASCKARASEDKLARCVELLLSRNADPNMVDSSHLTCLMLAARDGYSKLINLLVSHGAEINAQDKYGYTALSMAVQYNREEAVLKLLQLGANKNLRNKTGKSPADLAAFFKHAQIGRILASSSHISTVQAFSSMEETLSKFFKTGSEPPPSTDSVKRLDDLEVFLHGLDLGHLADIMTENDITWSCLLTMEEEDLEKIGITDPEEQRKVLSAVQQMLLDKVDINTISQLGAADSGSEDLYNFLISLKQQCCYLTETIQDVVSRFPRHPSQLVFSLDPKKEAKTVCNQLVIQMTDLQKEVTCLHSLLCQMDESKDRLHVPQHGSHGNWRMRPFTRVALSALGASLLLLLYKAAGGEVPLRVYRSFL